MSGMSTIVFNGSNAYELSLGHKATSWPQGAVGIEQVSAGVQLRSPTAGAGMILRIRAIGTNGLLISELSQTHILTELNNWQRAEKTFTLPAGTVKIELRLVSVGGAVLFAQPKLANGSAVGAYATNFAPQLTMITPTGIYTGTVTAEQIILTGGERLPDRLLTLNANIVSLRQGINGSDAKIASLTADMLSFSDTMSGKTSKLTADGLYTDKVTATQVKTGLLQSTNGYSWINLDNGRFSFGNSALAWDGALLSLVGKFSSRLSSTKPTRVEIENGQIKLTNALGNTVGQIDNWNAGALEGLNISTGVNSKYLSLGHIVSSGGLIVDYYINLGENPGGATERHVFVGDMRVRGSLITESPIYVTTLRDAAGKDRISIGSDTRVSDAAGKDRISVAAAGDFTVYDNAGNLVIWISKSGNFAQFHLPSSTDNAIGVDATGAYKIKNGTKTYL